MTDIIETPAAERPTLARTVELTEIATDGRNVEMLCAPYEVPAFVTDPPPFGDGRPYEEEFARGAFSGATKAPNRVLLEFEHFHPGLSGVIGHGAHLEERDDALYGRFRVTDHPDGDKALALIKEGVLTAASVFFGPLRSARQPSGVMRRLKVHLDRVALCREGAYPQAQVLAVRSAPIFSEAELIPAFDPELAARLEAAGVAVPDSMRPAA
jgi:HK97 family phage prohead protease